MQSVVVVADERVGLLTDISYILGKEGIRMEGVGIKAAGGKAVISLTVRDGQKAKSVLAKNGFEVIERGAVVLTLPDYFRTIEDLKKVLEEKKIALREWTFISREKEKGIVAIKVDKPRKAAKLLADFLI
ncbi:MAG: hypothetical protein QXT05_02125 [Candidatus Bilamarchaeaceae archaeon]